MCLLEEDYVCMQWHACDCNTSAMGPCCSVICISLAYQPLLLHNLAWNRRNITRQALLLHNRNEIGDI